MSHSTAQVPLAIASVGMVCCAGLNARVACAAIRAHVARFEEVPFHDSRGKPIVAAPAIEAVQGRQGYHRLGPMLCGALSDCIGGDTVTQAEALRTVPCLIVIGHADRPDYPPDLAGVLLLELRVFFGTELHPETRVACLGTTGFFEALVYARSALTRAPACIVVTLDSLINRKMLVGLDSTRRLKTEDNSDGVIPGEAAAALWLTSVTHAELPALAYILGIGFSKEPSALDSDEPNKGIGLGDAMRNALTESGVPLHEIDFRVGGLTGERLGFVEASTALARIQKIHKDNFELLVPAEQIGDVGAALAGCMTVAATIALVKGYAPGPRGIVYCSSDREKRAACVLGRSVT